jgi:hypothetical protein
MDVERMNTSTRRLLSGLATATVLLLGQSGSVAAADPTPTPIPPTPTGLTGNEMLSVQPSVINVTAAPGETATTQLTVRAAASLSITIQAQGLGQSADGNMTATPPDKDTSAYSARTMISASPQIVEMQPGDQVTVDVTVAVPADVGEGSRYAILTVTGMPPSPTGSATLGFGVELGVSAIVQIRDTPQTKTGGVNNILVGASLPGQPLPVTVSFLNTGNAHFGAIPNELVATAILQDSSGAQLGTATASGNQISVLPGSTRDLNLSMTPSTALRDGSSYHLEAGVGLKDGTILDRKALDFTWSGGAPLDLTNAALSQPATSIQGGSDTSIVILAAIGSALAVAAAFLILPRLRRRPRQGARARTANR